MQRARRWAAAGESLLKIFGCVTLNIRKGPSQLNCQTSILKDTQRHML